MVKMNKKENQKKWRKENKERFKELRKKWKENNPEKWNQILKKAKAKYNKKNHKKQRELDNIRQNTRREHGSLKKGFEYHHFKPYSKNNFIVLETGIHKFFHNHQIERSMTQDNHLVDFGNVN